MRRPVAVVVLAIAVTCSPVARASSYSQPPRQSTTGRALLGSSVDNGRVPAGPVPAPSGAGVPAPIVALAVFAGVFLLAGAVTGAMRLFARDSDRGSS